MKVVKPDNLGYWKEKGSGYTIELYINGRLTASKESAVTNITNTNYNIKDEFGYQVKTGDVVQVGVRVWVKDDKENRVYDSPAAKTSEPVRLISKSVSAYLNID